MATLDPSIYSQIRQPEAFNPLAEMAQYQQVQGLTNQNQLAQLAFQDRQRAQADLSAQRGIYASGAQGSQLESALLKGGFPDAALKFGKDRRENMKLDAETGSKTADTQKQVFENYKAQLQTVQDPQQAVNFVTASYHDPVVGPMLQKYGTLEEGLQRLGQALQEPGGFTKWQATASMGLDRLAQLSQTQNVNLGGNMVTQSVQPATGQVTQLATAPITQSADNKASNDTSRANNAASVGATIRGQNLTDARSRETLQAGRVPSGYRQNAAGGLEFIPGGPADPATAKRAAPTEFQGKSAAFAGRAAEADKIITDLTGKYSPSAINSKQAVGGIWGVGGALEAGANAMLSDENQKAEQAQRDFVNAILRQESGAAIVQSEFENARRQYFPQPNDGKAVLQQKEQNRKLAVQGLTNNAGNATIPRVENGATGEWTVTPVSK